MNVRLSDYEQKVVDFVESDGCFINAVFDPEGASPDFAYSIGFPSSIDQPNVIISGLELDVMKLLINDTLRLCRDGFVMEDFAMTAELLEGYDCCFRKVAAEKQTAEYFNSAKWFEEKYRGQKFDGAYQIVWPDKFANFPWERDFDVKTGGGQLSLWEGTTGQ